MEHFSPIHSSDGYDKTVNKWPHWPQQLGIGYIPVPNSKCPSWLIRSLTCWYKYILGLECDWQALGIPSLSRPFVSPGMSPVVWPWNEKKNVVWAWKECRVWIYNECMWNGIKIKVKCALHHTFSFIQTTCCSDVSDVSDVSFSNIIQEKASTDSNLYSSSIPITRFWEVIWWLVIPSIQTYFHWAALPKLNTISILFKFCMMNSYWCI